MDGDRKTALSHKRKSGSGSRQKQRIIGFRATDEERAKLEAAAAGEGLTLSSYIRDSLLKAPQTRTRRRPLADVAALAKLLGEMNKVGSNIEQLVKRVNFGETPLGNEIREAFTGYQETVAAIVNALEKAKR